MNNTKLLFLNQRVFERENVRRWQLCSNFCMRRINVDMLSADIIACKMFRSRPVGRGGALGVKCKIKKY